MRNLIFALASVTAVAATVPVRDACGEDASVIANIQPSDALRVEHGVVGESVPCYAVTLSQAGKTVRGYVSDTTLPAIVEFERKRALESRVVIPEPPPEPPADEKDTKKPKEPKPTGPPFETWAGADIKGRRLQIGGGAAKVTLVTFWSAPSASAQRAAKNIMTTEAEFRAKGVKVFGVAEAPNLSKLGYYMDDMGLDYPVVLDRQGLASKYGADASRGTTLVIDSANHIVAATADPKEIRAMVTKLLSSE
jgi:hypothetical protein